MSTTKAYPLDKDNLLIMAPMEGITDLAFRILCMEHGADLCFTEFIAAKQLISSTKEALLKIRLQCEKGPMGIQLYGKDPKEMAEAARIASDSDTVILDLNYGCSARKVTAHGCGSALLQNLDQPVSITEEVVKSTHLPVSVKTRLGVDVDQFNYTEHAQRSKDAGAVAFCLHGRCKNEKYNTPSRWAPIEELHQKNILPIIGNGDLLKPEDILEKSKIGLKGLMVGRAGLGNPFIFAQAKALMQGKEKPEITSEMRIETLERHLELNMTYKPAEDLAIREIRKHYDSYLRPVEGWSEIRPMIMKAETHQEVLQTLNHLKV